MEQLRAMLDEAIRLHQDGRVNEARAIYEGIIKTHPTHTDALHLLGVAETQGGRLCVATHLIAKAIALNPSVHAFYTNRGNALKDLGLLDAAVTCFERAIAIKFDCAEAYCNRGIALTAQEQFDAAVGSFNAAIAAKTDFAEAYYSLGIALGQLNQLRASVASYDRAVAIKRDFAEAYLHRGLTQKALKQFHEAIASFDLAVAVRSDYAEAYSNRGNVLKELKALDASVASYVMAIVLKPDLAETYSNLGNALLALNRPDDAVESLDRAIALRPGFAEAHLNKSLVLLLTGHFDEGWELHEARWETEGTRKYKRNFAQPLWLGGKPIGGKSILLHAEQGLGDTIQFCRFAKSVAALGARVIMEVPRPLFGLLGNLEGVSELIARDTALPAFDCHCPLVSLPLAFRTNLSNIPSSNAYLHSDNQKVSLWEGRLGSKTKARVGLVWSGNIGHANDHNRSIALSSLIPYLPAGLEYVCLQREVRVVDQATLDQHREIRHFGERLSDFTDTAALCELMDVVICVDSSVAHLSGALGKTTWVLLPYVPDWRWLLGRVDSPWYPTVKLYRQDAKFDWYPVLERVNKDLKALLE